MKPVAILLLLFSLSRSQAQTPCTIRSLTTAPVNSIRGLSAVTDSIVWISGTQGKVGRSLDGGQHWDWYTVPGCDTVDFRDIEAFSASRAIVMGIASPARIFLTEDGGKQWKQVYFNDAKGIFLDAMDFRDEKEGMVTGDPIDGRFTILVTRNGGNSWEAVPGPAAQEGEACFAASGTTLRALPGKGFAFASGGTISRLFRYDGASWTPRPLPLTQGAPSTGTFSFAFHDAQNGVAVGGDYMEAANTTRNCFITRDGGRTWVAPTAPPAGYRSGVEYLDARRLLTTGPSGTEYSTDGGMHWTSVGTEGYHVARKAKKGNRIFLAGSKGRIAVLEWHK